MGNFVELRNGVIMPHIGLGTYPLFGQQLTETLINAYDVGYRLIDTADNYYNEADLGTSLSKLYKERDAKRESLFLVTKVSDELYKKNDLTPGANRGIYFWKNSKYMQDVDSCSRIVNDKVNNSLKYLKTDYLDLLLIHRPYPDYLFEIWYEFEKLYKAGKVRAIGVCSCYERHFRSFEQNCEIMPMVNQIETSPLNTKEGLISFLKEKNVTTMVYSPLMTLTHKNNKSYINLLNALSLKYNKSNAQIILRFNVQRGLVPIPKSTNIKRLEDNFNIFDFELTDNEMTLLLEQNTNLQHLPESKGCPGF